MLSKQICQYLSHTPTFLRVCGLLQPNQAPLSRIDHAAFRYLTSRDYTQDFKQEGYTIQPETYHFPKYEAYSNWYSNPKHTVPRLFVSYYIGDLYPSIKTYDTYKYINNTNPFLSWTLLFRGHINHLAIGVDDIEHATETLIKHGIKMNEEGGLYKVSKDGLLLQTATVSEPYMYDFPNGHSEKVGYTFVELVQRKRDANGLLREGFESENASKIFTSTSLSHRS